MNIFVEDAVICHLERIIRQKIAPNFWSRFSDCKSEIEGFECFKDAVNSLYASLASFLPMLEILERLRTLSGIQRKIYGETTLLKIFKLIVTSTLHSQLPLNHQRVTKDFYKVSFKVFCNTDKSETGKPYKHDNVYILNYKLYNCLHS